MQLRRADERRGSARSAPRCGVPLWGRAGVKKLVGTLNLTGRELVVSLSEEIARRLGVKGVFDVSVTAVLKDGEFNQLRFELFEREPVKR